MGYAMPLQTTTGILQRLWARAFVLGDADMSEGHVAIVVADLCMIFPNVKAAVVGRLKDVLGDGHYNEENLLICATHTHAGPGGFSPYGLYNITTAGFSQRNFDCIVDGIADAVLQAHRTFERTARDDVRASLRLLRTHISAPKAAINRSPAAYANNPQDERAKYDSDVDEELLMLHITRESASKAQGASNELEVCAAGHSWRQGPGGRDDVTSAASIGELQAAAASRLLKSSQQHPGIPEELLAGPIRSALAWVDFGGGHHVAGGFTRDGAPARTAPPAKGYRALHPTVLRLQGTASDGSALARHWMAFWESVFGLPSGPFIAAFPQPASGDVSPNVNGVNCTVTG
eukprot:gene14252-16854_t